MIGWTSTFSATAARFWSLNQQQQQLYCLLVFAALSCAPDNCFSFECSVFSFLFLVSLPFISTEHHFEIWQQFSLQSHLVNCLAGMTGVCALSGFRASSSFSPSLTVFFCLLWAFRFETIAIQFNHLFSFAAKSNCLFSRRLF